MTYSKEDLKVLFNNLLSNSDYESMDEHYYRKLIDPIPREENKYFEKYKLNEIARIQNDFKDSYIISGLMEKLMLYKKVFVVLGATHAYIQRERITSLIERGGG